MQADLLDRYAKTAAISSCGKFRYDLGRAWGDGVDTMTFVMLNPSTANHEVDDPTIRRCIGFAKREGMEAIRVVNLFAYRSPSPAEMKAARDPIGPENDDALAAAFLSASIYGAPVIAAWGVHGSFKQRDKRVYEIAKGQGVLLSCLGVTNSGAPKHPLYLASNSALREWRSDNAVEDTSK